MLDMEVSVDVSYAAPQAHGIVNVALHREYSPGIVFNPREAVSLSQLKERRVMDKITAYDYLKQGYTLSGRDNGHTYLVSCPKVKLRFHLIGRF
jgi:hypothetical protein